VRLFVHADKQHYLLQRCGVCSIIYDMRPY